MQHPSSSDSIIYLSPNNARYPQKKPQGSSLLDDEAAPPHTQNPFQPCQGVLITPEKQLRRSNRQLEKSSSSKPLPARPYDDAYAHFEDDHIDPSILSRGKEERGEREKVQSPQSPHEQTVLKPKKYDEMMINTLLASPKKRPPLKAVKKEPLRPLEEEYQDLLQKMASRQPFPPPQVFFFRGEVDESLSKLVCFDLNPKNGKCVKYDHRTKTCHPFFRCYGCRRAFAVAAALGGHLSKCNKKSQHRSRNLQFEESPQGSDSQAEEGRPAGGAEVKVEESDSSGPKGKKGQKMAKKQAKRSLQPVFSTRAQILRSSDRLGRAPLLRAAKVRAGLLIHEVIEAHFE